MRKGSSFKDIREAILVPTGSKYSNISRTSRATQEYLSRKKDCKPYVIVSGIIEDLKSGRKLKNTAVYKMYNQMIRKKIKLDDLVIEGKSVDTLQNFLYTLDILKKLNVKTVYVSTNKTHFWRFKMFERKGKREGLVKGGFNVLPLYVKETIFEFNYGIIAYIKDLIRIIRFKDLKEASTKWLSL